MSFTFGGFTAGGATAVTAGGATAGAAATKPAIDERSKRKDVSADFAEKAARVDEVLGLAPPSPASAGAAARGAPLKSNEELRNSINKMLAARRTARGPLETLDAEFNNLFSLLSHARSDAREGKRVAEKLMTDVWSFEGHLRDAQDRVFRVSEHQPVPLPEPLLLDFADSFTRQSADLLKKLDVLAEAVNDAKEITEHAAQRPTRDSQLQTERSVAALAEELSHYADSTSVERKKPLEDALAALRQKVCEIASRDEEAHHATQSFPGFSSSSYGSSSSAGSRRMFGRYQRDPFENERAIAEERDRAKQEARDARFLAEISASSRPAKKTGGSAAGAATIGGGAPAAAATTALRGGVAGAPAALAAAPNPFEALTTTPGVTASLFPAPAAGAPAPAAGAPSIFGTTAAPAGGNSIFGTTAAPAGGVSNIFGPPAAPAAGGGLFGAPQTANAAPSLFGVGASAPSVFGGGALGGAGGLFSTNGASNQTAKNKQKKK
jgi:hypothetical protein